MHPFSRQQRWSLGATITASGMAFMAGSTVSVALPSIQQAFSATFADIQWVVNGFTLTLAALLLVGGSLGDRYGRRRVFAIGILIFTVGALLAAFSQTVTQLIALQALQGLGAALMIPGSLAIINASFPTETRGRAIGLWGGFSAGVASLGPFVGGWLIATFDWPAIFLLNVPVGLVALLLTAMSVTESRNHDAHSTDWVGATLILVGLGGISFGLIQGPTVGWQHPHVMSTIVAGVVALYLFARVERTAAHPMVPLTLFKNPLVVGANIITFVLYFALNTVIFFLVLNLQQVQGFSPIATGLALLPPIVLIALFSGYGGAIADRYGPRYSLIGGPLLVGIGISLLALPATALNYATDILPGLVLFGVGMAFVIAPLTKSAMMVDANMSGVASGVNNTVSRVAALLAVAAMGVLMLTLFEKKLQNSLIASSLPAEQQQIVLQDVHRLAGIALPETFSVSANAIASDAIATAFVYGFRWVMIIAAALALVSAVVASRITRSVA